MSANKRGLLTSCLGCAYSVSSCGPICIECKGGSNFKPGPWVKQEPIFNECTHLSQERAEKEILDDVKTPSFFGRGYKDKENKPKYDLIPAWPMDDLARVYTYGAEKVARKKGCSVEEAAHNWRQGIPFSECLAATLRHVFKIVRGEWLDDESGLPHAAHACFWLFAMLEFKRFKPELDDRYERIENEGIPCSTVQS